jgi:hypothetical protein
MPSDTPSEAIARSRAPTLFLVRMKSASVPKTRFWIKAITAWVCFFARSPIAHGRFFVRAQSAIRADGTPSAQVRSPHFDLSDMVGSAIGLKAQSMIRAHNLSPSQAHNSVTMRGAI